MSGVELTDETVTTNLNASKCDSDAKIDVEEVDANALSSVTSPVSNGDAASTEGGSDAAPTTPTPPVKMTEEELAVEKRSYVLKELVETEVLYVNDLKKVVEDYIPRMQSEDLPEGLQGNKDKIIFGNIQVCICTMVQI